MSDTDDDKLAKKFKAACERVAEPDQWSFFPTGDTDFEKGIRRGLELVLLTIRDECDHFDLWRQEDGSYWLSLEIYENLTYEQDFSKVIREEIQNNKGDDEAIRALSAYLRGQADEVDKAIGFRHAPHLKKAPEEG